MYCKMDVDDEFVRDISAYRVVGCECLVNPVAPAKGCGCKCSTCGKQCKGCIGFGFPAPPTKRVHEVLGRIRSRIKRQRRNRGRPPGYVRLVSTDVRALLRKWRSEESEHWIRGIVDPGPPVRVFDVIVIVDRRRE